MNDRLKFRWWNETAKQFEYFDFVNPKSFSSYMSKFIEQSTGLKDKNGKLVFEGDVICIEDFKRDSCGIYENCLGFVYWDNKNLCWSVKDVHCDLSWFDIEGYDIEVIGNIHQDSHLLGGE